MINGDAKRERNVCADGVLPTFISETEIKIISPFPEELIVSRPAVRRLLANLVDEKFFLLEFDISSNTCQVLPPNTEYCVLI